MKRRLDIMLLVCISLLCFSCKKFSNGDVTERTFQLEQPFQIVEMRNDVNVTLTHCDANNPAGKIVIKTGENLIDNISHDIEEMEITVGHDGITENLTLNKLIIRNDNTLGFLRPYDYTVDMTVYYDTLLKLIFNSNATLTTDTLRGYNLWTEFSGNDSLTSNLHLDINGGSGDFHVTAKCYLLRTKYLHGTSNLYLYGYAERAETSGYEDSHGIIDGKNLEADIYHTVNYRGTNTVIAKAFNHVNATNDNIGRIYYVKFSKTKQVIIPPHQDEDGHWIPADTIPDSTFYCPLSLDISGDNIMPYPD